MKRQFAKRPLPASRQGSAVPLFETLGSLEQTFRADHHNNEWKWGLVYPNSDKPYKSTSAIASKNLYVLGNPTRTKIQPGVGGITRRGDRES
jgi:hypothetical protein